MTIGKKQMVCIESLEDAKNYQNCIDFGRIGKTLILEKYLFSSKDVLGLVFNIIKSRPNPNLHIKKRIKIFVTFFYIHFLVLDDFLLGRILGLTVVSQKKLQWYLSLDDIIFLGENLYPCRGYSFLLITLYLSYFSQM